MWSWWQRLSETWAGWIGDREMELALRAHLTHEGYAGATAKFDRFRLAAIKRPGWLQVFLFSVRTAVASSDKPPKPCQLFGIVRQDERFNRLDIRTFPAMSDRDQLFENWSEGLIRLRQHKG